VAEGTPGHDDPCGRPLRSDARKNRARLLAAAEEAFAEQGAAVPIDEVARRAGVGVGTLYRHFPTKEALFVAIVGARLERLRDASACLLTAEDAGQAFFSFAEHLGEEIAAKADLAFALAEAGIDIKAEMADVMGELHANVEELIARAQRAGAVRDDLTPEETFSLVSGSCIAAQQHGFDPGLQQRMLTVVFDGLRRRVDA
jgi:AcrR family transcriptional regulator